MTRQCDYCKKPIPLGTDYIEVTAIGVKEFKKLFGTNKLDFCKLTCVALFWDAHTNIKIEKIEGDPVSHLLKRVKSDELGDKKE